MATCRIRWKKRGHGLVSVDKRFAINPGGRAAWHIVDLDTYNEAAATSLPAAKRAACGLLKRSRR